MKEHSLADLKALLLKECKGQRLYCCTDVGGTNTRVGFFTKLGSIAFVVFKASTKARLLESLRRAESALIDDSNGALCVACGVINFPGPVAGDSAGPISNFAGGLEDKMIYASELPQKLFPVGRRQMLNDLEAAAYGVLALHTLKITKQYFNCMWKGTRIGDQDPHVLGGGHALVVAPGTGLGSALLTYNRFSNTFVVTPLEFGMTNVCTNTEEDLFRAMRKELGERGDYYPEWDDICSGRGLERTYCYVTKTDPAITKPPSAKEISEAANRGDQTATKALSLYYKFLMRHCSQMAVGFVLHHLVICGDNQVNNSFFFDSKARVEEMKRQMNDHSMERLGFLSAVTMLRQTKRVNLNLLGCSYVAAQVVDAKHYKRISKL